jgi:hypothetical protein
MFIHRPHLEAFTQHLADSKLSVSSLEEEQDEFPVDRGMLGNNPLITHQGEPHTMAVIEPKPG